MQTKTLSRDLFCPPSAPAATPFDFVSLVPDQLIFELGNELVWNVPSVADGLLENRYVLKLWKQECEGDPLTVTYTQEPLLTSLLPSVDRPADLVPEENLEPGCRYLAQVFAFQEERFLEATSVVRFQYEPIPDFGPPLLNDDGSNGTGNTCEDAERQRRIDAFLKAQGIVSFAYYDVPVGKGSQRRKIRVVRLDPDAGFKKLIDPGKKLLTPQGDDTGVIDATPSNCAPLTPEEKKAVDRELPIPSFWDEYLGLNPQDIVLILMLYRLLGGDTDISQRVNELARMGKGPSAVLQDGELQKLILISLLIGAVTSGKGGAAKKPVRKFFGGASDFFKGAFGRLKKLVGRGNSFGLKNGRLGREALDVVEGAADSLARDIVSGDGPFVGGSPAGIRIAVDRLRNLTRQLVEEANPGTTRLPREVARQIEGLAVPRLQEALRRVGRLKPANPGAGQVLTFDDLLKALRDK